MKKSDAELVNSVARIKNRVAVPKYYYEELPKDVRALSFTVANLETLRQIEMVKRSLDNAIEKGESFKTWRENLDRDIIRQISKARLETVYRTNVHNVYNQSTRYNAITSDVTPYLMYSAVGDERTRPEHMRLNGVVKKADSAFWDSHTPPLGFNCVASYQKISGDFNKAFRSSYKGEMICIELKSGKSILGVTPNHPMMTDVGFISAKDLDRGDKLVCDNREIKGLNLSVQKHNDDLIATASNRFKSMLLHRFGFAKSSSFNFNGDIKFMDKNIDVVSSNSFLSGYGERRKTSRNLIFKLSIDAFESFRFSIISKCSAIKGYAKFAQNSFNKRSTNAEIFGDVSSAFKFILIESFGFGFDMINIFSKKFLRRQVSGLDSAGPKSAIDRVSADSELLAKFENAKTFVVETDEIINVYSYPYFGFVYDFESIHGLVVTDGIVSSNCRCGVIPMSKADADEIGINRRSNDSFPKAETGFGNKKMGDVLSAVSKEAEEAIGQISNKQMRAKFRESQANVNSLVDMWYEKNQTIFE